MVWREDMDSFILGWLRNHAVESLRDSCSQIHYKMNFQQENVPHDQNRSFGISAMLWLGNSLTPTAHPDSKDAVPEDDGKPRQSSRDALFLPTPETPEAPPYAMVWHRTRNVPIFNLPALLGATYMQQVRGLRPEFNGGSMLVKQTNGTVQLQQALWKLIGYRRRINAHLT